METHCVPQRWADRTRGTGWPQTRFGEEVGRKSDGWKRLA